MERAAFVNRLTWGNGRPFVGDSRLGVCLALSLVVHVAALLPAVAVSERVAFNRALRVELVSGEALRRVGAVPAPLPPVDKTARASAAPVLEKLIADKERPPVVAGAAAQPAAVIEEVAVAKPAEPLRATAAIAASEGEIDGEALRAYRISVAVGVRRVRATGAMVPVSEGGTVGLRVSFAENARGAMVSVIQSSGRDELDEEARALVRRALVVAPLPSTLAGRAVSFELPVMFEAGRP